MLADALADRGFDAIVEHDGRSGFHRLVDELLGLDLVITDVVMPGLDGETLIHTSAIWAESMTSRSSPCRRT